MSSSAKSEEDLPPPESTKSHDEILSTAAAAQQKIVDACERADVSLKLWSTVAGASTAAKSYRR